MPVGNTVILDGSDSRSAGPGTLEYDWVLVTVPSASEAALSDAGTVSPRFTADVAGRYTAELEVRAGGCTSDPDAVTITAVIGNAAPTADAGGDRRAAPGELIRLDGSASGDADGEPVSYRWEIAERPTGSTAVILDPHVPRPRLVPDAPGEYRVRLIVDDGWKTSRPAEVRVTADAP
ncbi:PKD domain-containing protein [Salinisphaera sp. PC39]|uniref:PKD domain-containing protein n=1 Tax=Salinisphaera sp. PC39 TaxID=1304156 RepID=UPI00333FB409